MVVVLIPHHRLLAELAEAEPYQEAYTALSEQVTSLLARNHLAEEEAEQLRQFNAEILGHHNPAQRISYVDRVRRDLAETRQVSSEKNHLLYRPLLLLNVADEGGSDLS